MALATLADAKRYIPGYSASDDAALTAQLDAAEEWVKRITGANWDASDGQTEKFYNVRDGEILTLKDENPTAVTVTAYLAHGSSGAALVEDSQYHLRDKGKIELIFARYGSPAGLPGATVEFRPNEWSRIEVAYTASNVVPTPVQEATAMIAAAWYIDAQGGAASTLISERLGDYSYTRQADGSKLPIPNGAMTRLRPWNRRLRVRAT